MREKGSVGEVLETRGVIGHAVCLSREVARQMTVPVLALVVTRDTTELSGGPVRRHCSLMEAGHGRSVVREVLEGGVPDWVSGGHQVDLAEETRLFQVAVGHGALRTIYGDELSLYFRRERKAPHEGLLLMVEVHSSHARFGGVGGSQE
jgi:hypothetical protein